MKHSSAGPDGITGQEVADLPLRFWELLAERLEVWQASTLRCGSMLVPCFYRRMRRRGLEARLKRPGCGPSVCLGASTEL